MLRRSRYVPALAIGACGLIAAAVSAPSTFLASASTSAAGSTASAAGRTWSAAGTTVASSARASTTRASMIAARQPPTLTAVAFPAPDAGWLLGQPASGPARAEIWHSGTAGQTWRLQWQGAGTPLSLTATDPAHAWALVGCTGSKPACGRELLATTDGGRRWRVIATLPKAVNQVQFTSGQLGLATSDSCLANRSLARCPGQILLSRDGGARWTPVLSGAGPVFATATASPAASPGVSTLWAAKTVPSVSEPDGRLSPSAVTFVTSTNGGRSWRTLDKVTNLGPLTPDVQLSLAADPSGLTWASVFDPLSCAMHGCGVAELLGSGDGGRSWAVAGLNDSYSDDCSPDGIVFSAAADGSAWAAAGRNGAACAAPFGLMYRYGPAGRQQLPPFQLTQVSSLDAVSQDVAYAIAGTGVLVRTADGGQHWTQLRPAAVPVGLLDALSANTAVAAQDAGDAGAILRSGNGGRGWSVVADLPGVITQLDFASPSDGVAATYQAGTSAPWQLWQTVDGGHTWVAVGPLPGGSADIYGPWIAAGGQGLLLTVTGGNPVDVGSGGIAPVRVWTTADGGSTWNRGALLPLGKDTPDGPASFSYSGGSPGWTGWLVVATASYQQRVAVADGSSPTSLPLLSSSLDAGQVQLLGRGTGFVWGLESPSGHSDQTIVSLSRTTDNGRQWRHSGIPLTIPAGSPASPLLGFSDANHGWLVLGSATWRTSDGGRTWTPS
jgi:photosystem II stability/assembly factor-like uncharacterized protein